MKMTIQERKKYACSLCMYSSCHKGNFFAHNRIHTGDRPFACQFPGCSSSFAQKSTLVSHSRIHEQAWPFSCSYPDCTRPFRTKFSLKRHMLIHLGEKPYTCNLCLKSFRQISDLNVHIRSHTGEKPYRCTDPGCHYECAHHGSLVSHKRVHSGERPFKCPVQNCSFSTAGKSHFKEHRMRHNQEKPFKCGFKSCQYSCVRSSYLRIHSRTHFGDKAKAKKPLNSSNKPSRTETDVIASKSDHSCSNIANSQLEKPIDYNNLTDDPKLRAHAFVLLSNVVKSIDAKTKESYCYATVSKHTSSSKSLSRLLKANGDDALLQDPKLRAHPTVLITDIRKNKHMKCYTITEKILDTSSEIQCEIPDKIEMNEEEKENEEPVEECSEAKTEVIHVKRKQRVKSVCKVCGFRSRKIEKFKMHLREHRERNEFFCSLCDFLCFQRTSMMKHWKTHDAEDTAECGELTTEITHMGQEMLPQESTKVNHESHLVDVPPVKVEEAVTRTVPLKDQNLKDEGQVPSAVTKREFKLYTVFVSLSNNLPSVYFACNLCPKQFEKEMKILNHLRQHTGSMPP